MSTRAALRPVEYTESEWQVRCDLAACYRLFVRYGWTDLIYTHISARHPTHPDRYLINPFGLLFEEITASSLIEVDWDGNVVRGDFPYNAAGHAIHSAVLQARPDVNWVLHTHTRAGMAVSCMRAGLLPLTQQAMFLQGRISYHDWDLQTAGPEECESLARDLGPSNYVMILHNHGLLTCAPTIGEAFVHLYTIESACKVQVDVMTSGAEIITPSADALARTAELGAPGKLMTGEREWAALTRWLDARDPSYRT
ncbi:MAG: class II aldolase/adducin family protein [Ectothiorhodospiraceae bacterium]|nr:class II aldolase/adducin family protein [Chromatiales bacterium]MCP5155422.1 class II aldolase/adducin family protein [Ectothiorhodospiraceae bacterium]